MIITLKKKIKILRKSRQSIKHFKYFKQSALSEFCRTDFNIDEIIQRMHDIQVSFEAVQKDSDNSTMQIKEKCLY
jgi:aspartokinase